MHEQSLYVEPSYTEKGEHFSKYTILVFKPLSLANTAWQTLQT